jgi:hypothetical protein
MSRIIISAAALSLVALATGCSGDKEDKTSGSCDDFRYELSAETEKDVTEISFDVSKAVPSEEWAVVITQDGDVIHEQQVLADEDGEVEVSTTVEASDDERTFDVVATPQEGEPCNASIDH